MAQRHEIRFLTYYGFAFSKDEFEDLACRIERKHSRFRPKGRSASSLVIAHLYFPEEKADLVYIEETWKSDARASERQLENKEWLINVKTARTFEEPGSKFVVEEDLLKGVVEWLDGLGYSSEDQERLKAVIPGIHFWEARVFLDGREGRKVSE